MRKRFHLAYADTLDARCAAAVVRYWAKQQGWDTTMTYPLPGVHRDGRYANLLTRIKARCGEKNGQKSLEFGDHNPEQEQIFVIGTSLPVSEMELLNTWGQLTYINHRDPYPSYELLDSCPTGLGADGKATCEVAWTFLFPKAPMPLCVQLIGRHTMNANDDIELWCNEILPFVYAMDSVQADPGDGWEEWEKLFETLASAHVRKRINEGKVIIRYLSAKHYREEQQKREEEALAKEDGIQPATTDDTDD